MISVKVYGLNEIVRQFNKSPSLVRRQVSLAIKASVFEVLKQNVDKNLRFKTPRAQRTGLLQKTIRENVVVTDFSARIGPRTNYAERVHRKNRYMPRLARLAQPNIDKHFENALDNIADQLTP